MSTLSDILGEKKADDNVAVASNNVDATATATPPPATPATPATPAEDVAPDAAPAKGYADIYQRLSKNPNLSADDKKKEDKREKARSTISAITDGLSAMANLWGASQGAAPAQMANFSDANKKRYKELVDKRERLADKYNNGLVYAYGADVKLHKDDDLYNKKLSYNSELESVKHGYKADLQAAKTEAQIKLAEANFDAKIKEMEIKWRQTIANNNSRERVAAANNDARLKVTDKNNSTRTRIANDRNINGLEREDVKAKAANPYYTAPNRRAGSDSSDGKKRGSLLP